MARFQGSVGERVGFVPMARTTSELSDAQSVDLFLLHFVRWERCCYGVATEVPPQPWAGCKCPAQQRPLSLAGALSAMAAC
jgi:hypothetical protein